MQLEDLLDESLLHTSLICEPPILPPIKERRKRKTQEADEGYQLRSREVRGGNALTGNGDIQIANRDHKIRYRGQKTETGVYSARIKNQALEKQSSE